MQGLYAQLLDLVPAVWWPFCRLMAAFAIAPFVGDAVVPIRARVGLALALAVACIPGMPAHSPSTHSRCTASPPASSKWSSACCSASPFN
ncbi:flagellar biosynthetic protein FliR [Chromobacterium vaccinii]|uniref:flagellar biosynthetic protein FliR n=1 Tax=Chromobacterium vaccinii TaxID=1108595 RepID=UPI000E198D9A|nr:flagellar biosynthetic protein FliR [Chromobacterium vaccinii]SUX54055.1 flagellar biosynthesis protein FliR [Chromobacterium vaccinii]